MTHHVEIKLNWLNHKSGQFPSQKTSPVSATSSEELSIFPRESIIRWKRELVVTYSCPKRENKNVWRRRSRKRSPAGKESGNANRVDPVAMMVGEGGKLSSQPTKRSRALEIRKESSRRRRRRPWCSHVIRWSSGTAFPTIIITPYSLRNKVINYLTSPVADYGYGMYGIFLHHLFTVWTLISSVVLS